jgi:type II secretory pathway component PulJ
VRCSRRDITRLILDQRRDGRQHSEPSFETRDEQMARSPCIATNGRDHDGSVDDQPHAE